MTIKDVARLAGVSPAAVSRYLNGGSLSEEKRVQVREAIRTTGYRPDVAAQTLRTGRVNQVGVIVPKIHSDSVSQVSAGISGALAQQGYLTLLGSTGSQILAADAMREAKVIADHGTGSRLPARGLRLDHDRP